LDCASGLNSTHNGWGQMNNGWTNTHIIQPYCISRTTLWQTSSMGC